MSYEVKERFVHDTSGSFGAGDFTNKPSPAVTVGVGGMNRYHYRVHCRVVDELPRASASTGKPPYQPMSMEQIRALPWNGFTCASTFSGGGGSSTGYRMAGFRVLYANEFIDAARATYSANCAEYTSVDGRDIRLVKASEVLDACKLQPGELDLFDGSPPCASFSTAGAREGGWGKVKKYSDKAQRTDDLFFEYARLVRDIQPKTFVAENVSGLVRGTAKGYFKLILQELRECGYRVGAQLLDASWLGVPQSRNRLIFVGVRNDLGMDPVHPKPFAYRYTAREALPSVRECLPGETCVGGTALADLRVTKEGPREYRRLLSIGELRRICGFPDDYVMSGTYAQQWERCGRAVPPVMMSHIAAAVRDGVLAKVKGATP